MIPLSPDQLQLFFRLQDELEPRSPSEREAKINQLTDQIVAELLRAALSEPPAFRGLKHGEQISNCTLEKRLGAGGCGEVWFAQQDLGGSSRDVAVKFIRPDHLQGEGTDADRALFHQEIAILKDLCVEGIVHLYDAGTAALPSFDQKIPYLIMEYVPGKPLTEALRGRDVRTQVDCFCDVCDAVQRAHNQGSGRLHLDLKPQNVLVIEAGGELTPKVLDFGLARCFDPVRRLDAEHFGWGTLPYMAPEQLDPKLGGPDFRTDVHALGVMLFEILTGQLPHDVPKGAPSGYFRAILQGLRRQLRELIEPPPTSLTDAQWQSLEVIVGRAVAVKPEERYRNPGELAKALADWLQQSSPPPPPPHPAEPEFASLLTGPDAAREFATLVQRLIVHQGRLHGFKVEVASHGTDPACWIREGNFLGLEPVTAVFPRWKESGPACDPAVAHEAKRFDWDRILYSCAAKNLVLVFPGEPGKDAVSSKGTSEPRASGKVVSVGSKTCRDWLRSCPPLLARYATTEAMSRFAAWRKSFSERLALAHCQVHHFGFPKFQGSKLEHDECVDPNQFSLPEVFIPQNLTPVGASDASTTTLGALLAGPIVPRVLLGGPGAGKTWILHYLAACSWTPPAAGSRPLVPLFLSLRDFARHWQDRPDLKTAIAYQCQQDAGLSPAETEVSRLEALLETGEAMLLFDGLDEVSDPQARTKVCRFIKDLHRDYPLCPVWVTSRIAGYQAKPLTDAGFQHFNVEPFTPGREGQQGAFARTWYKHRLPGPSAVNKRDHRVTSLLQGLADSAEDVQEMAGTPLLLTMMIWVHDELGHIPPSRGGLFDQCIHLLIHRRQVAKQQGEGIDLEKLVPPINPAKARRYYSILALRMQKGNERKDREGRGKIPRADLIKWLKEVRGNDLKTHFEDETERGQVAGAQADEFLAFSEQRSGLLRELGDGQWAFAHLSFQEFLAAERKPADEGDDLGRVADFIVAKVGKDSWRETLLLLLYQLRERSVPRQPDDPDDTLPFLDWLIERTRDRATPDYWRLLCLALCDRLDLSPAHRQCIIEHLLEDWCETGEFKGEAWEVLLRLSRWAENPEVLLLPAIDAVWRAPSTDRALAALHLRVRLLGWPVADAIESQRLARELEERVPLGQKPDQEGPLLEKIGRILAEARADRVAAYEAGTRCVQVVQTRLLARLAHADLPVRARADAGIVIGQLGDPRPGVGVQDGLPDLDWIEIPPGPFLMGSNKGETQWEDETPQFTCKLITQPYRISRYPVTVAQYQAFVEAGGYTDTARNWWTTDGWKWKQDQKITGPEDYDPAFQTPNHPRVGVSWYEAVAFCAWLTARLRSSFDIRNLSLDGASLPRLLPGEEIRLPNEVEWERAARHTDGRAYPWPDPRDKDKVAADLAQRCNMSNTGIGHTSAVGMFPSGLAQCGAADMAGNVWEWTRSLYGKEINKPDFGYAYDPADGRENSGAAAEIRRVLRGGSWGSGLPERLRCSYRSGGAPGLRGQYFGFRCVVVVGGSAPG